LIVEGKVPAPSVPIYRVTAGLILRRFAEDALDGIQITLLV
jgi:hypothetical protein